VLQALWQELVRLAPRLGLTQPAARPPVPYDPVVYQGVYARLLKHRQVRVLPMHTLLPTTTMSVYDFAIECFPLLPRPEDVGRFVRDVAAEYPDAVALQQALAQWYLV
jgi:hypothetical protein